MRRYLTERRLERLAYYIKSRANVTDTIPTNLTENLSILYTGDETTVDTFTFKPGFIYQYKDSEWHEVPVIADDEVAREDAQEALSRTASDIEYSGDVSGATNIAEALDILAQSSTDLGAAVQVVNAVPQNPDDDVAILYNGETGQGFTKGHIYQYNGNAWTEIEIVDGVAREAAGTASSQAQEALEGLNGKADKVNSATSGNFAGLDGNGNLVDSGKSADDFLSADTPLPEQVQSDWDETDDTKLDYIRNKPSIPAAQVNSDWNSSSGVSEILNKPTLGTAASKNSTSTVSENNTNLVESGAVKTAIDSAISRVYKPAGNKTCAQLTSELLVKANLGNVYNMTDSGTTTSDFVEGAGKTIELGDNVAIVDVGTAQLPSYKFDLLSGMVDLTNYIQKSQTAGLVKNDGTIDQTAYAKQSEMSVTPGTGTDADKTTIQLKSGTSATVLTQHIPASSSTPQMDGTGSAGSSTNYARADHVHPSDTSKQDVLTFDSVPTENSTNPVESGGIYTELQNITDIASSLPTDAVLHYSFDEVPDYPDGTRFFYANKDFVASEYTALRCTLSDTGGKLKAQNITSNTSYIRKSNWSGTNLVNKIIKARIFIHSTGTGNCYAQIVGDDLLGRFTVSSTYLDKWIDIIFSNKSTADSTLKYFGVQFNSTSTDNYFILESLYIGDGSYSTPIIDNANGQNNATNNGVLPVQGVSGKAIGFVSPKSYARLNLETLTPYRTVSFWLKINNYQSERRIYSLGRNGDYTYLSINTIYFRTWLENNNKTINVTLTVDPNIIGKWLHIAVCSKYDAESGTRELYVNGELKQRNTMPYDYRNVGIEEGAFLLNDRLLNSALDCDIDDFQIFDRALSETEVQALYQNKANTPKYYDLSDYQIDNVNQETSFHNELLLLMDRTFRHDRVRMTPKDITQYFTDGTFYDRLNGTNGFSLFEDIYPGDYFQMGTKITAYEQTGQYQVDGSQYVTVAGLDTLWGNGNDNNARPNVTYHHAILVPGKGLDVSAIQHFGRSRMNATDTAVGGYVGSEMNSTTIGPVITSTPVPTTQSDLTASTNYAVGDFFLYSSKLFKITAAVNSGEALTYRTNYVNATINEQLRYEFGSHLKVVSETLSNVIDASATNNKAGALGAGVASDWAWTGVQAVLMSETEVYGSTIWSSSGYDTGTSKVQLPLFRETVALNNRTAYYWLKDVVMSTRFALVSDYGYAFYSGASYAHRYVRPRFVIGS